MKAPENKKREKGGVLAFISRFLGGSSGTAGSSSGAAGGFSSLGSAASSGLGGLFASKAGIVGMVLGGATIAAGVGVIYNFVGPSSKPVYSPGLFENQYYESAAENATAERAASSKKAGMSSSSIDYFKEEAKKDGLFGASQEGEAGTDENLDEDALASAVADGDASVDDNGSSGSGGSDGLAGNIPRLKKAAGFSSGAGGAKTMIPRMGGMGGLSGGIGSKFQNVYKAPTGKSSSMKGALASKIHKSGKYKVPHYKKGGAYGQAKYAGKVSKAASISAGDAGSKTTAEESFSGETAGEGDLGEPMGGAGLGGAGVSNGSQLKGNDPNLNMNKFEPPPPKPSENVSPWKKMEDLALYGMIAAAVLVFITKALVKKAQAMALTAVTPPQLAAAAAMFGYAKIAAYAAIAAAALVVFASIMLISKYKQKWMGIMYGIMGGYLGYAAYSALSGIDKGKADVLAKQAALKSAAAENLAATVGTPV